MKGEVENSVMEVRREEEEASCLSCSLQGRTKRREGGRWKGKEGGERGKGGE